MRKLINSVVTQANRLGGKLVPRKLRQKVYWYLNPPDPRKRIDLVFDIVGNCNLKCPSCPVGNMGQINPQGKMSQELYQKVLTKAHREYVIQNLVMYNWGESFLHPDLSEFISFAKSLGVPVALSSNLNVLRGLEKVLSAGPDTIRISLSGFYQKTYEITHRGGNIEAVKENMRTLSETLKRMNSTTQVTVYYHKYKTNLEELPLMKAYAFELGFQWAETWAYYMPYEKVADFAEGKLPPDEVLFVENQLALPLGKAIKESTKYKDDPCSLLNNQIVLDLKGNLLLCCAVYDYDENRLGSFLDLSPEKIDDLKKNQPTCERCSKYGLQSYFLWEGHPQLKPAYELLVEENLEGVTYSGEVKSGVNPNYKDIPL